MTYKEDTSKTAEDIQPFDLVVIAGLVYQPIARHPAFDQKKMEFDESKIEFEFLLHSVGEDYNAPEQFKVYLTIPAKARMDTVVRV